MYREFKHIQKYKNMQRELTCTEVQEYTESIKIYRRMNVQRV